MKKIYIAFAVLAAAAFTSCQQEKSFNDLTPVGENGIAFKINGTAATKSAENIIGSEEGISIPINLKDAGASFTLKETVTELNPGPSTRGVPAYTVNIGTVYTTMGVYATGNFGYAEFEVEDSEMYPRKEESEGDGWRYWHNYASSPWPTDGNGKVLEKEKVDFFLRMPAAPTGISSFNHNADEKTVTFTLSSPETGSAQQDILFANTSISKEDHDGFLPNGAPVLMYHALSGVKFRTGNNNTNDTKTIITKVELLNLYDEATCIYNPNPSGTQKMFTWSGYKTNSGSFSQAFKTYTYDKNSDNTVDYISGDDNQFGDTWYQAGKDANNPANKNNLNDEEGSMTFWFIPQTITKDVTLNVYFKVLTPDTQIVQEIKHTIKLGEQIEGVEWKAGQLRTYTLEPKDIDVEIFDTMSGYSKTGLHVTNTGNVDEYIRMLVIGNWYGWLNQDDYDAYVAGDMTKGPSILAGYKTDGDPNTHTAAENAEMASPWFREDPVWGSYFDDSFKLGVATAENWVRGDGGYYYTKPIGPGDVMSTTAESGTMPLFQSYVLPSEKVPDIYIPVAGSNIRTKAKGVHLVLEIVVQAIGVPKKADGTGIMSCWEAWTAAVYPDGDGSIGPKN